MTNLKSLAAIFDAVLNEGMFQEYCNSLLQLLLGHITKDSHIIIIDLSMALCKH